MLTVVTACVLITCLDIHCKMCLGSVMQHYLRKNEAELSPSQQHITLEVKSMNYMQLMLHFEIFEFTK